MPVFGSHIIPENTLTEKTSDIEIEAKDTERIVLGLALDDVTMGIKKSIFSYQVTIKRGKLPEPVGGVYTFNDDNTATLTGYYGLTKNFDIPTTVALKTSNTYSFNSANASDFNNALNLEMDSLIPGKFSYEKDGETINAGEIIFPFLYLSETIGSSEGGEDGAGLSIDNMPKFSIESLPKFDIGTNFVKKFYAYDRTQAAGLFEMGGYGSLLLIPYSNITSLKITINMTNITEESETIIKKLITMGLAERLGLEDFSYDDLVAYTQNHPNGITLKKGITSKDKDFLTTAFTLECVYMIAGVQMGILDLDNLDSPGSSDPLPKPDNFNMPEYESDIYLTYSDFVFETFVDGEGYKVTSIGSDIFSLTRGQYLESIRIPETIINIEDDAFSSLGVTLKSFYIDSEIIAKQITFDTLPSWATKIIQPGTILCIKDTIKDLDTNLFNETYFNISNIDGYVCYQKK